METTITAAVGETEEEDLCLGLVPHKLARTTTSSYPFRMMNYHPFPSSDPHTFYSPSTHCRFSSSDHFYDVAGSGNAAAATSLQPFPTASPFKNPGHVRMGAYLKYPFTWAQWQELEKQALIYKHLVSSVPIPPDLLISFYSRSLTDVSSTLGSCASFNMRFSNGSDPEPGRCRRTDGKKWRCSRDAGPDQKYCERHMHRGRPRSRKHVETRTPNAPALPEAYHQTPSGFLPKPETKLSFHTMVSATSSNKDRPSPATTNPPVLQPYEDHLRLHFVDYKHGVSKLAERNNQSSCFYLKDIASDPDKDQSSPPPSKQNQTLLPKEGNFSISSLTLSIPGEEDMDQTQMGGPLGEILVLQPSTSAPSPSCVLQRTLASLSDSSSGSSPTLSAAKSEIALQWLMS